MATTSNATENGNEILAKLNEMRKKSEFCDFTIIINRKRFLCHRLVLISSSEYFRALFTPQSHGPVPDMTTLKCIDCNTFEVLLDYLYTADLKITSQNAFKLLKAGDYLQMEKFTERCIQYITNNPKVDNLLEICLYARNPMKKTDFAHIVAGFVANNIQTLIKNPLIMDISFEVLDSILRHVSRNPLVCSSCPHNIIDHTKKSDSTMLHCTSCHRPCADSKEELFAVLVKWVEYNLMERMKFFPQLAAYSGLPNKYLNPFTALLRSYDEMWKRKCNCRSRVL